MPGKMTAFDTDIRVPLIVTGPGVPAGATVEDITENIDLAATFAELAGLVPSADIDGRSLVPFLRGQMPANWRTVALIEHRGPVRNLVDPDLPGPRSGNPPTYEAIRATFLYVEYADGMKEYHDLTSDPHELHNGYAGLSAKEQAFLSSCPCGRKELSGCRALLECRAAEPGAAWCRNRPLTGPSRSKRRGAGARTPGAPFSADRCLSLRAIECRDRRGYALG